MHFYTLQNGSGLTKRLAEPDIQYWSKVYDIGRFREPLLKLNLLPFAQILIKFDETFCKDKLKCLLLNAFFRIELNLVV